jgi:dihydroorotase
MTAAAFATSASPMAGSPPSAISAALRPARPSTAAACTVLPGVVDSQVHFREPGLEHKEDLETWLARGRARRRHRRLRDAEHQPADDQRSALADKVARARAACIATSPSGSAAPARTPSRRRRARAPAGCRRHQGVHGLLHRRPARRGRRRRRIDPGNTRRRAAFHSEDEPPARAQGPARRGRPVARTRSGATRSRR